MSTTVEQPGIIALPDPSFSLRGRDLAAKPLPSAAPGALLQAITTIAADPAVDIEKIERLWLMHKEMMRQQAESAFAGALARAQANILPIFKNRANTHTRSTYADLASINAAIVPIYTAEGLSLTYDTETRNESDPIPEGKARTIAILYHESGFSRRYHLDLVPDSAGSQGTVNKTPVQAAGSTNEYARRYLARMIFNLSTTDDREDDDGNGDKGDGKGEGPRDKKEPQPLPTYTPEQVTTQLPAWRKLVADGTKTAGNILNTLQSRYTIADDQIARISAALKPTTGEIE